MVLVGVQPSLTHVPPTCSLSTNAVRIPASASARHKGVPACPDPTTIASYLSVVTPPPRAARLIRCHPKGSRLCKSPEICKRRMALTIAVGIWTQEFPEVTTETSLSAVDRAPNRFSFVSGHAFMLATKPL